MSKMLGRQASSKPVTMEDRAMSERHLATRGRFDDAPKTVTNLRRSISYNKEHADEHDKAVKEREKDLKKALKSEEKERKK